MTQSKMSKSTLILIAIIVVIFSIIITMGILSYFTKPKDEFPFRREKVRELLVVEKTKFYFDGELSSTTNDTLFKYCQMSAVTGVYRNK